MRSIRNRSLGVLTSALLLTSTANAQAPATATASEAGATQANDAATESARSHFRLGVDFYKERNFRAALIEFQRAYADAPQYKLLYNLGQASLELQEYASAIDFLAAYLREGGDAIPTERRTEVEDSIKYLQSRIAHVTLATNRQGAELYVDDTLVGHSPLTQPLRVGAGRHKLSAIMPGLAPVERQLDVAAGDEREVKLTFIEPTPLPAAERSAPVPSRDYALQAPPEDSSSAAPIVLGVTTGLLAASAITLTIVTGAAQQDYQEELLVQTTRGKLDSLRSDAETKALITDVLWGAALVSAVVTTIVILVNGSDEHGGAASSAHAAPVKLTLGAGALTLDATF